MKGKRIRAFIALSLWASNASRKSTLALSLAKYLQVPIEAININHKPLTGGSIPVRSAPPARHVPSASGDRDHTIAIFTSVNVLSEIHKGRIYSGLLVSHYKYVTLFARTSRRVPGSTFSLTNQHQPKHSLTSPCKKGDNQNPNSPLHPRPRNPTEFFQPRSPKKSKPL